jgi:hypothetical protein
LESGAVTIANGASLGEQVVIETPGDVPREPRGPAVSIKLHTRLAVSLEAGLVNKTGLA